MPVFALSCPQCGHESQTLVMAGTRMPEVWVCGRCGSEQVQPKPDQPAVAHPWEGTGGYRRVCPCCGL